MTKKFATEAEANRYADRLSNEGLDPYVEQEGDIWFVYSNAPHWDDD